MTSQRLVEDFAKWLWERDHAGQQAYIRVPDNYLNEAAVFLAGELGQRLQHDGKASPVDAVMGELDSLFAALPKGAPTRFHGELIMKQLRAVVAQDGAS